ncbi:MAG: S41 family peptidase [Bacteroidales bacterium]|nr:S41 family peptidase [Bacteroidales bacterium]
MIKKHFFILGLILLSFTQINAQESNNFKISKSIEIFSNVMRQLNLNYVDTIQPVNLTQTAIDAMLNQMDPYTVYIPASELGEFNLLTKGEYGGIGAVIQQQGNYVIITEPYKGFPAQLAGMRAGDKIIDIDGKSAKGMSASDVSNLLKGNPGTKIAITVQHYGDSTNTKLSLTREKIRIPNVPYYGVVGGDIGYINLTQFSPNAANDVRNAFLDLKNKYHIKGVILDLRNNGGGLLDEAVNIANIFVKKGTTIVTTKGKLAANNEVHETTGQVTDAKIPLAVLVNGNTASASEIVSGSMQDLDRGVIIGQKTFGKGLVQNIVPIPYGGELKITIAKYYIPSGRCIQKIDYFNRNKNGDPTLVPDSLIHAFKTQDGRTVYDGGGITPDIITKPRIFSQLSGDLYAQNYIFNFANQFVLHNKTIPSPADFSISQETFDNFKKFVLKKGFDYETETGALIKRLVQSSKNEDYYNSLRPELDSLSKTLTVEKKKDLDKHKSEIETMLRIEIATRYYYEAGKIESSLINDNTLEKAIKVLNDKKEYEDILKGKVAKKSEKKDSKH